MLTGELQDAPCHIFPSATILDCMSSCEIQDGETREEQDMEEGSLDTSKFRNHSDVYSDVYRDVYHAIGGENNRHNELSFVKESSLGERWRWHILAREKPCQKRERNPASARRNPTSPKPGSKPQCNLLKLTMSKPPCKSNNNNNMITWITVQKGFTNLTI